MKILLTAYETVMCRKIEELNKKHTSVISLYIALTTLKYFTEESQEIISD